MKIKIIENGGYLFIVKEENIFKDKGEYINLSMIKDYGHTLNDMPIEAVEDAPRLLLAARKRTSAMLTHDIIRNPTIQEYFFMSQLFKKNKMKYNKKRNETD